MTKLKVYLFKLGLTAILTALAIVLNSFLSIRIGNVIKISLYGFPLIILGLFVGPLFSVVGGITCALINDIVGYGISLSTLWWSLAPITWALIPALLRKFYFIKNKNYLRGLIVIGLSAFMAFLANNLAFYLDLKVFGYDYGDLVLINVVFRLISLVITTFIFSFLLFVVSKPLGKRYNRFRVNSRKENEPEISLESFGDIDD